RARLRGRRRGERIVAQRLAELPGGRPELIARSRLGLLQRGELGVLEVRVRLAELEVAEMAECDDVLGPQLPVLEPRCDRFGGAALVLIRRGELLTRVRVEWALRDLLLR